MGDENPIRTLGDYSKLATRAIGIPSSSPQGTTWYLFDPTPSGWCKTDAYSTDFDPRIQTNTSRIFLNLWTHLTLMVKIGKERACVYFNFPFKIKLAIGLNVFQQDPSPHGRILLPDSLLNSFHREGPQNSTFGSKSKSFMTLSISSQDEPWTNRPVLELPKRFHQAGQGNRFASRFPSTSDGRLIELENQVQRLMEAHLAPTQPTQVNKITTSCEICSGPHDTQYCMEDPERAFVEYASSRTDEAGGKMTNKIDTVLKAITNQIAGALPSDTVKNPKLGTHPVLSARSYPTEDSQCPAHIHSSINTFTIHPKQPKESQVNESDVQKLNSMLESLRLVPRSSNAKFICSKEDDGEVMFIEIKRDDEPQCEDPNEGEGATTEGPPVEYFDTFST
ncbi:hypothetical protein Tco_1121955 [Tanacetum coccineum]|uniref:MAK10-like protein n=1 Tax=Tanacetum coccineum TaxID=301880 RepID=A0ABQ5J0R0_9ASTR